MTHAPITTDLSTRLTGWGTVTLAVVALAASLIFSLVLTSPQPVQAQSCLSSSEARSAISSGQVVPLSSVQASVRARGYNEIASTSLCRNGGSFVYQVVAVSNSGASARLIVDGASGTVLSEQ